MLEVDEEPAVLRSSCHFSRLRRRAFMKKLLTVVSSRPSCWEMVICISLDGRLFSLKMAKSVRRWRSVNTRRDFFWELFLSLFGSCSLRLHASLPSQLFHSFWSHSPWCSFWKNKPPFVKGSDWQDVEVFPTDRQEMLKSSFFSSQCR